MYDRYLLNILFEIGAYTYFSDTIMERQRLHNVFDFLNIIFRYPCGYTTILVFI